MMRGVSIYKGILVMSGYLKKYATIFVQDCNVK